jgi:RNA polymerase sigma factor (sigma-70 family)
MPAPHRAVGHPHSARQPRLPTSAGSHATELATRAARGDRLARDELVLHTLGLACQAALSALRQGLELDDLSQEAAIGLLLAADRYRPGKGTAFTTYALPWIRHCLQRATQRDGTVPRIPAHMQRVAARLVTARDRLGAELGRSPSTREIARAARVPLRTAHRLLAILAGTTSLDARIWEDGRNQTTVADRLASPEPDPADVAARRDTQDRVRAALARLPEPDRAIVARHFGIGAAPAPLREIASSLGISRQAVHQRLARALRALRRDSSIAALRR